MKRKLKTPYRVVNGGNRGIRGVFLGVQYEKGCNI